MCWSDLVVSKVTVKSKAQLAFYVINLTAKKLIHNIIRCVQKCSGVIKHVYKSLFQQLAIRKELYVI